MRRALLVVGVIFLAGCGGHKDASVTRAASTTTPRGERVVIHARLVIADSPGAEPIATGKVVSGSTLAGSPFCVGGKILDTHASKDPTMKRYGLIARTITCPDGIVKVGLTPEIGPQGPTGKGSWRFVRGTGAYAGLRGKGKERIVYDPNPAVPARETLTATLTR